MTFQDNRKEIAEIKKEMSAAFLKFGAITFFIGIIDMIIGLFLKNLLNADPFILILPVLISLPIIIVMNWRLIQRTFKRLRSRTSYYD